MIWGKNPGNAGGSLIDSYGEEAIGITITLPLAIRIMVSTGMACEKKLNSHLLV
jgi:hypothetical protein